MTEAAAQGPLLLFSPILLQNLAATAALAQRLASCAKKGDVLALCGPLGVGKTAFAQKFIRALGWTGEVTSPTFTLVQHYETPAGALAHFDLYRLEHEDEIEETGFFDACADGLCLVEWPERAASYIPRTALTLTFSVAGDGARQVVLSGLPAWAARLEGA